MKILLYYTCKNTIEEKLAKVYDNMLLIRTHFVIGFHGKLNWGITIL